jgi:MFS family permease
MNFLRLFVANKKILIFGIILTFYSGFGQTFLLSLYIPSILQSLNISQSLFSTIYAAATLCSGLTIIFAGRLIDRMKLLSFTLIVITGMVAANILAGLALNLVMIFLAIFMLRFFGQGLLSHTAMTAMGRYFTHTRGKALSIVYLGYPLAESFFPISIVFIIGLVGWRESFFLSAAFILITLLPLVLYLLNGFNKTQIREGSPAKSLKKHPAPAAIEKEWSQGQILRNRYFYLFAPTVFIVGFTLTAAFYFQSFIADFKGWSVEMMAVSISAYAVSSLIFSIYSGILIDRFGARRIYPFILIPMALGLVVVAVFNHPLTAWAFWFFLGISAGANPTTGNALYAETYGVKNLGSIRSIFTFVMITSTAAGPLIFSFLLDAGAGYNFIHLMIAGIILINVVYIYTSFKKDTAVLKE